MAPCRLTAGIRLLVCGGRDFNDEECVVDTLDMVVIDRGPVDVLIHGGARGADTEGCMWAVRRGVQTICYRADWRSRLGRRAGFVRNQQMIDFGKPDLVVAFPGGSGTADMTKRARKAGIEVLEISP